MSAKQLHIAGQVIATIAQFMMGPTENLFGWSPEVSEFAHAAVSALQAVAAIFGVYLDPKQKEE